MGSNLSRALIPFLLPLGLVSCGPSSWRVRYEGKSFNLLGAQEQDEPEYWSGWWRVWKPAPEKVALALMNEHLRLFLLVMVPSWSLEETRECKFSTEAGPAEAWIVRWELKHESDRYWHKQLVRLKRFSAASREERTANPRAFRMNGTLTIRWTEARTDKSEDYAQDTQKKPGLLEVNISSKESMPLSSENYEFQLKEFITVEA